MSKRISSAAEFWHLVTKLPDDGCWLYEHDINAAYYGNALVNWKGRYVRVHELAWDLLERGPITPGHGPVQTCGNVLCVKPDHLKEDGTDGMKIA
jgi:hypothetical protein